MITADIIAAAVAVITVVTVAVLFITTRPADRDDATLEAFIQDLTTPEDRP